MELWTHVVLAVVVSASLGNATTQHVTGRCCASGEDGVGGGCHGTPARNFTPPIEAEQETTITWVTHALNCPLTHSVVYHDLSALNGDRLVLKEDELMLRFGPGGLFLKETREYCVEAYGDGYRGAVCHPNPDKMCDGAVCIPKCCGDSEVLIDFRCTTHPANMSLQFYSVSGKAVPAPPTVVMVGDMVPDCGDGFPVALDYASDVQLLANGKLLERETRIVHELNHYCIENINEGVEQTLLFLACSEFEGTAIVVEHFLQRIGYVISVIFLVATILFHVFLKSLQNLQGMCLISYMVSMAVAVLFLFILSQASSGIPHGLCIFSGFVLHFSFLAIFFWLNILCFDVWRVVKSATRAKPLLGILNDDTKNFRLYCLYGWGVPLLISVVAAIMHYLPEEHAINVIPPGFGKEICWLSGEVELTIYFYAYIAVLFILDCGFLGHVVFMLYKAGGACNCFRRPGSETTANQHHFETLWHQLSLFILMVLCWTTELLSWKIPPRELWIVSNVINSFQGLLVFIIFISNRNRREKVIQLLRRVPLPCCESLRKGTQGDDSHGAANWHGNSSSVSFSGANPPQGDIQPQDSLDKTDIEKK